MVPVPWLFNTLYPPAAALSLTYPPFPPGVSPADLNATGTANDLGNNCQCQQEAFGCTYEWQWYGTPVPFLVSFPALTPLSSLPPSVLFLALVILFSSWFSPSCFLGPCGRGGPSIFLRRPAT